MFPEHLSCSRIRSRNSSALVITLAVLVLVSAILVVFFNQSTLNRQISFSSAGQYRADLLAHTGLDTIVGDLRTEIAAGSTTYTSNNISIYVPTTNYTVVPCQVANQGFTNLVAQSASTSNFWTGTYFNSTLVSPVRSATNNSTQTASANGRYIKINQWNRPGLLGDPGSGTLPTISATYTKPPDWVLVTRQGAVTNANSLPGVGPGTGTLSDKSVGNMNYVVGRYAYTIYNEGGLIDVNVAGLPSTLSGTSFTTRRGLLSQVDLANIPGIASANTFVQWRNVATATSASLYTNYVFNTTNGFVPVAGSGAQFTRTSDGASFTVPSPGDQSFVSRQDLISYAKANTGVIATSALQYLGTFSRELNAPTFAPSATRAKVGALDDQFNPSLIATSVAASFTRINGTQAVVGEPLIKYRFPLSRLSWITSQGVSTSAKTESGASVTATDVLNSFGLTWSTTIPDPSGNGTDSGWIYNHGAPVGTIYKLSDIAGTREPDFFELLQAGILYGSLGQIGPASLADNSQLDGNTYNQVIQIGANLFDQYDTDSVPTLIQFGTGGEVFSGVESLPYMYRVFYVGYRPSSNRTQMNFYFIPEMWNPHYSPATNATQRFRFLITGQAQGIVKQADTSTTPSPGPTTVGELSTPTQDMSTSAAMIFNIKNTAFGQPTALTDSTANTTADTANFSASVAANDTIPDGNGLGVYIAAVSAPDSRLTATSSSAYPWLCINTPDLTKPVTFWLQYETSSGSNKWVTYSRIRNLVQQPSNVYNTYDNNLNAFTTLNAAVCAIRVGTDPRTERFSCAMTDASGALDCKVTIRPVAATGASVSLGTVPTGWLTSSGPIGALSGNLTPDGFTYTDPDGVQRRGEGAYANGTLNNGGYPLATPTGSNPNSRPIILNRAFRSVGELGYASRDMPWKNLDFFTTESSDSALLDLFCLNDSPNNGVVAGKVDLNTSQLPVLQALLNGAIKSDPDNTTLTAAQATSLITSLRSVITTSGPLANRSDLVNRWIGSLPNSAYANGPDTFIKLRRESAIRSMADAGMTRTWNLLIDVVAQNGRYALGATNLNQFTVEGEKRYWLHLAIDRYTGDIIAEYLEPVYD